MQYEDMNADSLNTEYAAWIVPYLVLTPRYETASFACLQAVYTADTEMIAGCAAVMLHAVLSRLCMRVGGLHESYL